MSITAEKSTGELKRRNRTPEFTERDAKALRWIGEQYGARYDVLGVLLARLNGSPEPLSTWGVRNQIERWKRKDWPEGPLVRTERALGDTWVTLTRYGSDRAGFPESFPTWRVPITRVRHCHAVNIVRLWWEGTDKAQEMPWVSERMTYLERGKTYRWHVPDGVVKHPEAPDTPGPSQFEAVEVELTHKGRNHYETEVLAKLRSGLVGIWYYVPDEAFGARLRHDIEVVQARRRSNIKCLIRLLPEVPGVTYMDR